MHKDWTELTKTLSEAMAETRKGVPEAGKAFAALAATATAPGALGRRTKELIALAISVAIRCDGCIGFHAKAAQMQGASRQEVLEVIAVAIYMGGGPSQVYGAQALEAYDQFHG